MVSFLCELNFIQNAVILLKSVCEIVWTDIISSIELDWPFSFFHLIFAYTLDGNIWHTICFGCKWFNMFYVFFLHFDRYHCESILGWNLQMDVCMEKLPVREFWFLLIVDSIKVKRFFSAKAVRVPFRHISIDLVRQRGWKTLIR